MLPSATSERVLSYRRSRCFPSSARRAPSAGSRLSHFRYTKIQCFQLPSFFPGGEFSRCPRRRFEAPAARTEPNYSHHRRCVREPRVCHPDTCIRDSRRESTPIALTRAGNGKAASRRGSQRHKSSRRVLSVLRRSSARRLAAKLQRQGHSHSANSAGGSPPARPGRLWTCSQVGSFPFTDRPVASKGRPFVFQSEQRLQPASPECVSQHAARMAHHEPWIMPQYYGEMPQLHPAFLLPPEEFDF